MRVPTAATRDHTLCQKVRTCEVKVQPCNRHKPVMLATAKKANHLSSVTPPQQCMHTGF